MIDINNLVIKVEDLKIYDPSFFADEEVDLIIDALVFYKEMQVIQ